MTDEELQEIKDRLAWYGEFNCDSLLGSHFVFKPGESQSMSENEYIECIGELLDMNKKLLAEVERLRN